jgi:hypothetical protein
MRHPSTVAAVADDQVRWVVVGAFLGSLVGQVDGLSAAVADGAVLDRAAIPVA